jgi:metal-sulfur cluster biosynthetic enzyme
MNELGEARQEDAEENPTDTIGLREQILEALKNVHDPELGINIVDLGLVYGVEVQGDTVHVTYTLTTMGCPIGPLIEAEMRQFVSGVPGIENVDAEMVLRPPWTPEMMSEEAKAALGFF